MKVRISIAYPRVDFTFGKLCVYCTRGMHGQVFLSGILYYLSIHVYLYVLTVTHFSCISKNDTCATRMLLQKIGHVVYLILNHNPTRLTAVVFGNLAGTKLGNVNHRLRALRIQLPPYVQSQNGLLSNEVFLLYTVSKWSQVTSILE